MYLMVLVRNDFAIQYGIASQFSMWLTDSLVIVLQVGNDSPGQNYGLATRKMEIFRTVG